jgi:hypothetical protein
MGAMTVEGTMHTFETPGPVDLQVELQRGQLTVVAEHTAVTTVDLRPLGGDSDAVRLIDSARVEQRGNAIVVLLPRGKSGLFRHTAGIEARIVVPTDSAARLETASADIETRGRLGSVAVQTGSGDVSLDQVADVLIRTGSGDVRLDRSTGSCSVKSGSADVSLGSVQGDADISSGSGDVEIESVGANLRVKTGSGDLVLHKAGDAVDAMAGSGDVVLKHINHGRVKAKTGSGDIAIGVADGTAAYLDIMTVTGDVHSDLDASGAPTADDVTVDINVSSGTGDVVLQRA